MTNITHKTIAGGSIDYTHYIRKSHEIRSDDAHRNLRTFWAWLTRRNNKTAELPSRVETASRRARPVQHITVKAASSRKVA